MFYEVQHHMVTTGDKKILFLLGLFINLLLEKSDYRSGDPLAVPVVFLSCYGSFPVMVLRWYLVHGAVGRTYRKAPFRLFKKNGKQIFLNLEFLLQTPTTLFFCNAMQHVCIEKQ